MADQVITQAHESFRIGKYEETCELLESIIDMHITNDHDRGLILDAAYLLTQTFLTTGPVPKATALGRMLVNGNRTMPGRSQQLHASLALMSKVLEAAGRPNDMKPYMASLAPDSSATLVGSDAGWDAKNHENLPPYDYHFPADSSKDPAAAIAPLTTSHDTVGPPPPGAMKTYPVDRTQTNDPSLTRMLFGSAWKRMKSSTKSSATDINYITDFKNPSNPLSPHYTPYVTVPVPKRVFEPDSGDEAERGSPPKSSHFLRRGSATSKSGLDRGRFVRMSRDEYMRCWARDSNGNYLGTEPEGSGEERLRRDWIAHGRQSISQLQYVGYSGAGIDPFQSAA